LYKIKDDNRDHYFVIWFKLRINFVSVIYKKKKKFIAQEYLYSIIVIASYNIIFIQQNAF